MSDITDKTPGQIKLSAIQFLPERLLAEINAMQGANSSREKCALDDLFLFVRTLEVVRGAVISVLLPLTQIKHSGENP